MYIVLPTLPLLRRPSGPSDPTGSGSGGFNPALAWGLTAPCGSGACSGPRERKIASDNKEILGRTGKGQRCQKKGGHLFSQLISLVFGII